MKTKNKDGWTTCPQCNSQAWSQTIALPQGIPVTILTCSQCDRMACKHCKEVDWTGLEKSHCGDEKAYEKPKK